MEFKVPEMGEGVQEGELVSWRVKEGDSVSEDQPLCEVMTDKATVEIPSPFKGKITQLRAKEGEMVQVGQAILDFDGQAGESKSAPEPAAEPPAPSPSVAPSATSAPPAGAVAAGSPTPTPSAGQDLGVASRVLAAPATRRLARERGIDLGSVPASGPHGRVMKEDVERMISGGAPLSAPGVSRTPVPSGGEKRVPLRGLRKKIAEKMRLSKDRAAHFTYVEEADVTELVKLRKQAKEIGARQGVKVTYLPFIMKGMVAALRQYPMLNSTLDEDAGEIVYKHFYNISLSIQTEDGLTAPVVKGVEHKSVLELAREINDIVERARAKRLTKQDFEGGTITLTNAGTIGGLFTTPVINYPEVAILGFNKIFKKPTVVGEDEIKVRDWTYFSISLDHRVVDGADAAEFMKLFISYIENPSLMLLESF